MAHPLTPAGQAQLELLRDIIASGNGSKAFNDAVKKLALDDVKLTATPTTSTTTTSTTTTAAAKTTAAPSSAPAAEDDPLRALRTLPLTGYEPEFAAACSRAIDVLREGGCDRGEYRRAFEGVFADPSRVDVYGFGVTSGTSGSARKVFPQTAEVAKRRFGFFFLKPPLVSPEETRMSLFVPARPEVLYPPPPSPPDPSLPHSSSSPPSAGDAESKGSGNSSGGGGIGEGMITMGPVTAVFSNTWIRKLDEILDDEGGAGGEKVGGDGRESVDPATDVDPLRGGERQSYPLAVSIAQGVDVEQRLYLIWLCTLARGGGRVAAVSDTFGGSTLNAVRVLRLFGRDIANALRAGKLSDDFFGTLQEGGEATKQKQEKLRRAVDLYIGEPRPREAQELEDALASEGDGDDGDGLLAKLLPNVRFVSAVFTGSMSKYLSPMRALLRRRGSRSSEESSASSAGEAVVITEFYGGSEGIYGINEAMLTRRECFGASARGSTGGCEGGSEGASKMATQAPPPLQLPRPQRFVATTGIDVFMEFLPVDDGDGDDPSSPSSPEKQPLSLVDGEIPIGKDYELIITNLMALARYRVGDVVRVVGTFEPPPATATKAAEDDPIQKMRGAPVFEFVGRAGSAINLVWEKYDEGALVAAVADAAAELSGSSRSTASPWKDFAAREDIGQGGEKDRYLFYLEPTSCSIEAEELKSWADALEKSLRARNDIYRMLTTKGQIAPLRACVVSAGSFDALRDAAVASGTAHAQYKAPVVVESNAEIGKRTRVLEERVVARVDACCSE